MTNNNIKDDNDYELKSVDYGKLIDLVDRKISHHELQVQCCQVFEERKEDLGYEQECLKYYRSLKIKLEKKREDIYET